jgi:predicted nucleotidyltransferase
VASNDGIGARFEAARDGIARFLVARGVRLAYVFGSVARGVEGRDSDLDVAVLFDESIPERERAERRIEIATELIGRVHVDDVDVVSLNDATPLLAQDVVTHGRPFLGSKADRVRFEVAAVRRYIDTQWIRDRYAEALERRHRGPRTTPEGRGDW